MKLILTLILLASLNACSSNSNDGFYNTFKTPPPEKVQGGEIDSHDLPEHNLNNIVQGLAFQMVENSQFVNPKTPIAVASFVDLDDLETTSWLGNQISESFMHEFQRHGFIVIDYKATGIVRVTPKGDFVFSRHYEDLPEYQIIDYFVAGTLVEQEDGYLVNARMVGMLSHVVVATAQTFIPKWALGNVITKQDKKQSKAQYNANMPNTSNPQEKTWVNITK